jgi:hypothetical protein
MSLIWHQRIYFQKLSRVWGSEWIGEGEGIEGKVPLPTFSLSYFSPAVVFTNKENQRKAMQRVKESNLPFP